MIQPPGDKTTAVVAAVIDDVLHGRYGPGDPIPTERTMGERMALSRVTVRRAYDRLAADGIITRRQGHGTCIAKHFAGRAGAPAFVGLVAAIDQRFAARFAIELERRVAEDDALLVLKTSADDPEQEQQAVIDLVARGVRDLVVWPSGRTLHAELFARLRILGVNLVFYDRLLPGPWADFVGLDNTHAITALWRHLQRHGAQRLRFLRHADLDNDAETEREAACLSLKAEAVEVLRIPAGGRWPAALRRRLAEPDWAIIGVNDEVAIEARRHAGPDALIGGIDGTREAAELGITSIAQPLAEMAQQATALLGGQRQNGSTWTPEHVRLRGRLIARGPT